MVTIQFLLEGVAYAIQHSGVLLRDAVTLCDQGSYPSSVVLALFGREELGKFRLLLDAFEKVETGGVVEPNDLKIIFKDHKTKQEGALLSISQHYDRNSPADRAASVIHEHSPGTPEFQEAFKVLEAARAPRAAALPNERHRFRMAMLYVEPASDWSGWKRPQDQTKNDAMVEIIAAVNDYSSAFQNFISENALEHPFTTALMAWKNRPTVLSPVWPKEFWRT